MSAGRESDAARWQRLKAMLGDVLERPAHEREAAIEALSGGDAEIRGELQSLLTASQADDEALHRMPSQLVVQAVRAQLGAGPSGLESGAGLRAGGRVGPWRLVALIARGGQGEVYRAERADGQFEQQVAIKLLSAGVDRGAVASRFAAERQLLAGLDHPNLARLLDGGTTEEGMPYFVMELVEGEPVDRYCAARSLSLRERLKLFRTVCQVVGYAHSKAIVHRDLKCDNILVTPEGVVKLVDFGIAKRLSADALTTATAQRMMTLAYSSPEQVRGEPVTSASDVYSLGVVLYQLLTDTSPYGRIGADSGYELTRAICDTEPVPPSRVDATTSPALTRAQRRRLRGDLDAVVLMALRKEPARRYADATTLGEDIFRHLESLPVRARRGALSYKLNRFVVRHRLAFGMAMLANLALVAGLGVAVYEGIEAKRQQDRAERHLASVREIAGAVMFDVHRAIENLPGSTPARKLIVDKAVGYLDKVMADAPDDPSALLDAARAYRQLADIQNNPFSANLGDLPGARRSADRALALSKRVLELTSSTDQRQRSAQIEAINVLQMQRRMERSPGHGLAEALALSKAHLAHGAPDRSGAMAIAQLYVALSEYPSKDADPREPLDWLDRAQTMISPVLASAPDDVEALRVSAVVQLNRGTVHFRRDGPQEARRALRVFDDAEPILARMRSLQPGNTRFIRDVAALEMMRGLLFARLEDHDAAIAAMHRGLALLRSIASADPVNYNARLDVATAEGNLGGALLKANKVDRAMEYLAASIDSFEAALSENRLDDVRRVMMTESYIYQAQALRRKADAEGKDKATLMSRACALMVKSRAILRALDASRHTVAKNLATAEAALQDCR